MCSFMALSTFVFNFNFNFTLTVVATKCMHVPVHLTSVPTLPENTTIPESCSLPLFQLTKQLTVCHLTSIYLLHLTNSVL